jgi:hypothetical protein
LNGNVVDYTTKINDVIDGVFNFSDLNLMWLTQFLALFFDICNISFEENCTCFM